MNNMKNTVDDTDSYARGKQDGVRLSMNLIQTLSKIASNSHYKQALEDVTQLLQHYANDNSDR